MQVTQLMAERKELKSLSMKVKEESEKVGLKLNIQYSCLENPMDRGVWQATVHGVTRVGRYLAIKPLPFLY